MASTPRAAHSAWTPVASVAQLPNVAASSTQDARLVQGDTCYVIGTGSYQCDTPTLGAAVWSAMGGGGVDTNNFEIVFNANGDLAAYDTLTPIDGQPVIGVACTLIAAYLKQEIDSTGAGAGGVTTVSVFKRTGPSARVSVAAGSIAQGSGDNAQLSLILTIIPADLVFAVGNSAEFEFNDIQVDGDTTQPNGVTVTLVFSA